MLNGQKFFLLTVGLLFLMFGCDYQRDNLMLPDDTSSGDSETSFNQNLMPILSARCALSGCHVAGGPDDIDFSTYQTFIRGGEHGAVFRPGNAQNSHIIEEIVSGRMPPGGPPLTNAQIQLFKDWINQQDPADFPNLRYEDDHDDHDHDD